MRKHKYRVVLPAGSDYLIKAHLYRLKETGHMHFYEFPEGSKREDLVAIVPPTAMILCWGECVD